MKKVKIIIKGVLVGFLMLQAGNAVCSMMMPPRPPKKLAPDRDHELDATCRSWSLHPTYLSAKKIIKKAVKTCPYIAPILDPSTTPKKMAQIMDPKHFNEEARKKRTREFLIRKRYIQKHHEKSVENVKKQKLQKEEECRKLEKAALEHFEKNGVATEEDYEELLYAKKELNRLEFYLKFEQNYAHSTIKSQTKELWEKHYIQPFTRIKNGQKRLDSIVAGIVREKAGNESNPSNEQYRLFVERSKLISEGKNTAEINQQLSKLDYSKKEITFFEEKLANPPRKEYTFNKDIFDEILKEAAKAKKLIPTLPQKTVMAERLKSLQPSGKFPLEKEKATAQVFEVMNDNFYEQLEKDPEESAQEREERYAEAQRTRTIRNRLQRLAGCKIIEMSAIAPRLQELRKISNEDVCKEILKLQGN